MGKKTCPLCGSDNTTSATVSDKVEVINFVCFNCGKGFSKKYIFLEDLEEGKEDIYLLEIDPIVESIVPIQKVSTKVNSIDGAMAIIKKIRGYGFHGESLKIKVEFYRLEKIPLEGGE